MNDDEFQGKRVLVTGAGTGIGRGVALTFARYGADVVFHYFNEDQGAAEAVNQARELGRKAEAMQADFTDVQQVKQLAHDAQAFLGGIDVLINNAGITMNRPFQDVSVEQFDTLFHVNIRAMFFMTQSVYPGMAEQGKGAVVNLASVHAYHSLVEHSVYAATKASIVAFTRTLSTELAPKGIRVNAIAPGWVLVENHLKVIGNIDLDAAEHNIPAGVMGKPEDIGEMAAFLASDRARYIVGQTFIVDGGQMSLMPGTGDFHQPTKDQFGQGYVPGL